MFEDADRQLVQVEASLKALRQSEALRDVFAFVLRLGNYLNGSTKDGGAYGFKLNTLKKLSSTKTKDNKSNLLQYLVQVLRRDRPDALKFRDDLAPLEDTRSEMDALKQEVTVLARDVRKIGNMLKAAANAPPEDRFGPVMGRFHEEASAKVEALEKRLQAAVDDTDDTAQWFGERKNSMKWEALFAVFRDFSQDFKRQGDLLDAAQKAREREARSKAAWTKKKPTKKAGAGGDDVVDNVLGQLQSGSAAAIAQQVQQRRRERKQAPGFQLPSSMLPPRVD
ncbi:MAG: hypothetical protein MHM6MM_002655 [Cercozoa sp. M6MM]